MTPEERLIKGICLLAKELEMDQNIGNIKKELESFSKDELVDIFIDIKTVRLQKENLRLVNLLLDEVEV